MIISFSGLDGSGKTTQITRLLEHFKACGLSTGSIYDHTQDIRYHCLQDIKNFHTKLKEHDIIHTRFRLNSDENNDFMNVLEYSDFNDLFLSEATALQGYYDARKLDEYMNHPVLKEMKTLVYDRYFYDEIAFKSVYGCNYNRMRKMYEDFREPDFCFYLRVDSEVIYQRNQSRKDSETTIYKNLNYIRQLSQYFDQLAEDCHMFVLDGELPEAVLHDIIWKHIY